MAEVPASTPSTPSQAATIGDSRHNRWFFIGFYSLAVLWGIRSIYYTEPSLLDLLIPLAVIICLGWWALTDARRRRHPIPMLVKPWFLLLAPLVVPGYVIWSRRWRGVGGVTLHSLAWYLTATVALHVGGFIMFGKEWLRAFGL